MKTCFLGLELQDGRTAREGWPCAESLRNDSSQRTRKRTNSLSPAKVGYTHDYELGLKAFCPSVVAKMLLLYYLPLSDPSPHDSAFSRARVQCTSLCLWTTVHRIMSVSERSHIVFRLALSCTTAVSTKSLYIVGLRWREGSL